MGNRRDEWLRDVDNRQRNTVFPDTSRNEARFLRNLAASPRKPSTAIGAVLAVFVATGAGILVVASFESGFITGLALVIGTLVFAGSMLVAVAWGTRRALGEAESSRRKRRDR